tara:strand:+ start:542 stop:1006 length:465 start_codon:yes stop_codon:yes gene_type:complete
MVAVTSMPMGQPMGQPQMNATSPMPNPMGGSAPNPMMPNPMQNPMMGAPMGGPPPQMGGQPPASPAPNANLSTQINGYGGSASGRAKFKSALGRRKNIFLQSQQMQMRPQMQMQPQPQIAPIGRALGNNANVGSAPVQLMNGGVVPLFGGLGRY